MVWAISYRPKPDSYPSADLIEGTRQLVLEDKSDDGGTNLAAQGESDSGRRVKPESVPKVIRWNTKRKLLDYETKFRRTVSDRFRALIEEIEPGVHQFEPIQFINKDGSELAVRWFWQVCNRLESVDRETTNLDTSRKGWRRPPLERAILFFDPRKIGDAKFWHDKHVGGGRM